MFSFSFFRIICLTFIIVVFFHSSEAFLKQMIGATLMGNMRSAISSFRCAEMGRNFTSFKLYTRSRSDKASTLIPNDWNSLQKSDFDSSLPTKVIIHGFLDNVHVSEWISQMKNALLREGQYNVIFVDWSCANGLPYSQAVKNSRITATHLGDLIIFLKKARGVDPADFHIIGHSLGSHIAGLVGQRLGNLGRISALDPAGPLFYDVSVETRLDPSDASFIDVIHTDAGNGLLEGLGLFTNVGHIDFYPNGGHTQPGCHSSPIDVVQRLGIHRVARYYLSCDHFRSVYFYIESIEQKRVKRRTGSYCQYVGVQCRDWETFAEGRCTRCNNDQCAVMGFYSDIHSLRTSGDNAYYLETADDEPYCVYQYGVTLETGPRTSSLKINNETAADIYIEVKTVSGVFLRLKLNGRHGNRLQRGKKYTYLTTSKYPVGHVKAASLWWGKEEKPRSEVEVTAEKVGFNVKRLEISPIKTSGASKLGDTGVKEPQKTILCSPEDKILGKNELLPLVSSSC